MASNNTHALPAGAVVGSGTQNYRIECVLGAGGFGITYKASYTLRHGNLSFPVYVALKEHFVGNDCERDTATSRVVYSNPARERVENSLKDFISEARRLHKVGIGHPNIVRVNEVFKANNTAYYVMEYLDGESLRSYVKRHGALSEDEMMQVMRPIIDAVGYLHRNRMTHLDVKPDNIMLATDDDGRMRPVLIDFGLSKHYGADGRPTSTINTLGCSDGYAPTEQYAGITTFSPTADIYALGATMLFCLTGRDPRKSTELRPGEIDGILSGLSLTQPLRDSIARAMATSQYDRTPSAAAMINDPAVGDCRGLPADIGTPTARLNREQRAGDFCEQRAGHGAAPTEPDKPTQSVTASSTTSRRPLIIGAAVTVLLILAGILLFNRGCSDSEEEIIVAYSTTVAVDSQQPVGAGHGLPAEPSSTAEPAVPATVDVRGRITDAATNRPLKEAKVSAPGAKTVTTGTDGTFLLTAVIPGRKVTVRYDGTDLYTFAASDDGSTHNIVVRLPEPEPVQQPAALVQDSELVSVEQPGHLRPADFDLACMRDGRYRYFTEKEWNSATDKSAYTRKGVVLSDFIVALQDLTSEGLTWDDAMSHYASQLPNKDQGEIIAKNRDALNRALKSFGGEEMDTWFWTKTEYDSFSAWLVFMYTGNVYRYDKANPYRVRAVAPVPVSSAM